MAEPPRRDLSAGARLDREWHGRTHSFEGSPCGRESAEDPSVIWPQVIRRALSVAQDWSLDVQIVRCRAPSPGLVQQALEFQ